MAGAGNDQICKESGKLLNLKTGTAKLPAQTHQKSKSHGKNIVSSMSTIKLADFINKVRRKEIGKINATNKPIAPSIQSSDKQCQTKCKNQNTPSVCPIGNGGNDAKEDVTLDRVKKRRRRKRKNPKNNVEMDEPSRLQRRTRYLLIRMKVEHNLLDAYSAEGWKGQSRQKIKPEKELQRAKKQILKCKLGMREAIRQLDLLGSVGRIKESAIAPDGSVHHEHIHCAKCKLREAFPDNDIILCDGTCNCAFHQQCLDPPLLTENIPPGDQGWFCKFCECKMEIIDAMNAHLGTKFSMDSTWQDIFKEEASVSDGGNNFLNSEQEWPSDDSEDNDYNPKESEKIVNSCSCSEDGFDSNDDSVSSSSSLWSLENEVFAVSGNSKMMIDGADSDEAAGCEIVCGPRQRRAVDYKKLYDEMFGKDAPSNDQISEDEDWGPNKRKRKEKESDAATTLMTLCEREKRCPNEKSVKETTACREGNRPLFRIPANAVEKLRLVFSENELPSRAVKENLSKQLGVDSDKVNKWFKNARYLALKTRKGGMDSPVPEVGRAFLTESGSEVEKERADDQSENLVYTSRDMKGSYRKNKSLSSRLKKQQHKGPSFKVDLELDDNLSLKLLKEMAMKAKKRVGFEGRRGERRAEAEMERLCKLKNKLEKLEQVLLRLPNRIQKSGTEVDKLSVMFVPVAELREKT